MSYTALRLTRQCVIDIPTADLSAQVVGCGNTSGQHVDKFKAWIDPACKDPRTLHHRGRGAFMVAGETVRLPSRMR